MAAADDEGDAGLDAVGEPDERGEEMAFEVIDGEEWSIAGESHGFGGGAADEERAGEAWAAGGGEAIDGGEVEVCFGQGGGDDWLEPRHVIAGGEFGDDAAVGLVFGDLGGDDRGEDVAVAVADGGGGFVAGAFDGEDDGGGGHGGNGGC